MLLSIQFPLADIRCFLSEQIPLLGRPTWPSAYPDVDFVRSFGSVRTRRLGGLPGWIGEHSLCEANRALRVLGTGKWMDGEIPGITIPYQLKFRRFYSDGLAVGKFEVGITTRSRDTAKLTRQQTQGFIKHVLNLPVKIPSLSPKADSSGLLSDSAELVLGTAGQALARLYSGS